MDCCPTGNRSPSPMRRSQRGGKLGSRPSGLWRRRCQPSRALLLLRLLQGIAMATASQTPGIWAVLASSPTPNRSPKSFLGELTARAGDGWVPKVGAAEPRVPLEMFPALHWGHRPHPRALHLLPALQPRVGASGQDSAPRAPSPSSYTEKAQHHLGCSQHPVRPGDGHARSPGCPRMLWLLSPPRVLGSFPGASESKLLPQLPRCGSG